MSNCQEFENKRDELIKKTIEDFDKELFPTNIQERVYIKTIPEARLVRIAELAGESRILRALGGDTNKLDNKISSELEVISRENT